MSFYRYQNVIYNDEAFDDEELLKERKNRRKAGHNKVNQCRLRSLCLEYLWNSDNARSSMPKQEL